MVCPACLALLLAQLPPSDLCEAEMTLLRPTPTAAQSPIFPILTFWSCRPSLEHGKKTEQLSTELLPLNLAHEIPEAVDLHLRQPGIKAEHDGPRAHAVMLRL